MLLHAFDHLNLFWPNVVVTFIGAALALPLMAMLRVGGEVGWRECFLVRWGSRVALCGYGGFQFVSLLYCFDTGYQPWIWDVLTRAMVDVYLIVGVLAPYVSPRMPGHHHRFGGVRRIGR